jgi:lipopolysaccharide assembly outer membrane protein LptD (OstA)
VRLSARGALVTAQQARWSRPQQEITLEGQVKAWRQGTHLEAHSATVNLETGEIKMTGASGLLGQPGGR